MQQPLLERRSAIEGIDFQVGAVSIGQQFRSVFDSAKAETELLERPYAAQVACGALRFDALQLRLAEGVAAEPSDGTGGDPLSLELLAQPAIDPGGFRFRLLRMQPDQPGKPLSAPTRMVHTGTCGVVMAAPRR